MTYYVLQTQTLKRGRALSARPRWSCCESFSRELWSGKFVLDISCTQLMLAMKTLQTANITFRWSFTLRRLHATQSSRNFEKEGSAKRGVHKPRPCYKHTAVSTATLQRKRPTLHSGAPRKSPNLSSNSWKAARWFISSNCPV